MNVEHYKVPVRMGFLNSILVKFPLMEVLLKFVYWKIKPLIPHRTVLYLKSLKSSSNDINVNNQVELQELSNFLRQIGVNDGVSIVVHSSYDSLKSLKVLPRDIVSMLCSLVGNSGNLIMPANRIIDYSKVPFEFNVGKSRIWSGALPFALFLDKSSIKSRIPINSVVVAGQDKQSLVCDELNSDDETPCGKTSAWYKVYLKQGLVLGLGVDLVHNLTMTHIVEDSWVDEWPSKNWYDRVNYHVIDNNFERNVSILQRKEYIGKYFYTEARLAHDLEKSKILKAYNFKGISVQVLNSVDLVNFLKGKRPSLYPFYDCFLLK